MIEPPEEIQARIEELRANFVAALAGRLSGLEAAAHTIESQSSLAEIRSALATLGALSHQVAGSASILGFLRLGDAAGELELMCEMLLDVESELSREQCTEVCRLLAALKVSAKADTESLDTRRS